MNHEHMIHVKQYFATLAIASVGVAALAFPELAFAQDGSGAEGRVTTFFNNINSLLNVASIAIVTIAVIFAGYQIAFAHKRISDVAPILIGGLLIGAASQIAGMLLLGEDATAAKDCTAMVMNALPVFNA